MTSDFPYCLDLYKAAVCVDKKMKERTQGKSSLKFPILITTMWTSGHPLDLLQSYHREADKVQL